MVIKDSKNTNNKKTPITDEEILQFLRDHEQTILCHESDSDNEVGDIEEGDEPKFYETDNIDYKLGYDSDNDTTILKEADNVDGIDNVDSLTNSPEDYDSDDNDNKLSELKEKFKTSKDDVVAKVVSKSKGDVKTKNKTQTKTKASVVKK
jgi:hypothetical protein